MNKIRDFLLRLQGEAEIERLSDLTVSPVLVGHLEGESAPHASTEIELGLFWIWITATAQMPSGEQLTIHPFSPAVDQSLPINSFSASFD